MKANGRGEGDCGAVGGGGIHARGREGRNLGKERGDTLETPGTPLCKEVSVSFQQEGRERGWCGGGGGEGGVKEGWCQECLVRALRGWDGGCVVR